MTMHKALNLRDYADRLIDKKKGEGRSERGKEHTNIENCIDVAI